ncbi:MAG: ribokinase [Verrucomicrobiae bacterium]|nr:ribokinase [Verrucomicrobiae bacterium]
MKRPRIVVVGSSNTDMVVKSRRIPAPGETVTGGTFVLAPGGKGANQAVAAARLGAEVTFVARVGADAFGDQAIAGYTRDGILVDLIARDEAHATGVALILVDDRGENAISVASGANHAMTPEDISRAAERIRAADVLVLQLETPLPAVTRAAEIAAGAGVTVILDPAPAPDEPLPEELLRHVTCIKPNETEAERLTGVPVRDEAGARAAAARLLDSGPRCAIITLGAKGALLAEAGGMSLVPTIEIQATDSTAAGDAFTGALACGLGSGMPLPDAVRLASLAGALTATRMGAQPSLPTRSELHQFCRDRGMGSLTTHLRF